MTYGDPRARHETHSQLDAIIARRQGPQQMTRPDSSWCWYAPEDYAAMDEGRDGPSYRVGR